MECPGCIVVVRFALTASFDLARWDVGRRFDDSLRHMAAIGAARAQRSPAILFLVSRPLVEVRGNDGSVKDVDSLCDNNYSSEVEAICSSLLHGLRRVHLIVRTATPTVSAELNSLEEFDILMVHFSGHGGRTDGVCPFPSLPPCTRNFTSPLQELATLVLRTKGLAATKNTLQKISGRCWSSPHSIASSWLC